MIETGKVPNEDYAEYLISTAKRTVKQEDSLIRQIVYTGLSAKTPDPINLGIIAPTSEGKTYPVIETLKLFPKEMVSKIGSMSTKVLVRHKGVLVDENNEPIGEKIKALKIQRLEHKKGDAEYQSITLQLQDLFDKAHYRIKLSSLILVFLEPPHHELWTLLKPILAHDSYFIEHPFVDRTEHKGFEVKNIVTEGFPACIFCSAKDESDWPVWPEIVTRFLITSPNMKQDKYKESNILIGMRKGLPGLLQKQLIVSDDQIELARNCCRYVLQEIESRFAGQDPERPFNPVWIPYRDILAKALPATKGSDVRTAKRIFSFLNIVPLARLHLRPTLFYDVESLAIASLDDLGEVLRITHSLDGIPAYKLDFFKEVFCKCYQSKGESITSRELCEYVKITIGKNLTTDNMKKTYLNELQNAGYIDCRQKTKEEGDAREYIYWPVVDISNYTNSDRFDNYLQNPRINLSKTYDYPEKGWLLHEILAIKKYRMHFLDSERNQLTVEQFLDAYKPELLIRYFAKPLIVYKSQRLGRIQQIPEKEWSEQSRKISNWQTFL